MKSLDRFPFPANYRAQVWIGVAVLLLAQWLAIVHASDLGAHDSEPCDICLATGPTDDDEAVQSSAINNFFHRSAHLYPHSCLAAQQRVHQTNHLIRAPPK